MSLYNLVNAAVATEEDPVEEIGDTPSYIKIGQIPFLRLYLVSNRRDTAREFASCTNKFFLKRDDINFRVQQLSLKGRLRFYRDRYFLCKLFSILGDVMDLDTNEKRRNAYTNWISAPRSSPY